MFITPPFNNIVLRQMSKTDTLLELCKDVLVNPLVCGGAPRNWFFNSGAKDVDIFVDPQEVKPILDKLQEINARNIEVKTSEELPEQYRSNFISCVITFDYSNIIFQIIIKQTTASALDSFPCSLSLIFYKDYNIQPLPIFFKSVAEATLYFTPDCNQRYERKLIKYFNNYKVKYKVNLMSQRGYSVEPEF